MGTKIEEQLAEIQQKLDFLVEELQEQKRRQREFEDLKHDLALIGKDAFFATVTELEEVSPYFESADLLHLLKKILRNTRNLIRLMDSLESLAGFLEDAKPLAQDAFLDVMEKLDQLDQRGYFDFLRESATILDTVVDSFTVEDIQLLRENITTILLTIRNLTQPDMLATINNAVGFFQKMEIAVDEDVSYRRILSNLRDPEVKRGLLLMTEFMKKMAQPEATRDGVAATTDTTKGK